MLKHDDIWRAIDTLASRHGLTASGLARKAGLDPTTFNKSKRITASGRRRWPSTESLAKALEAVGATLNEFVGFVEAEDNGKMGYASAAAAQATAAPGEPQGAGGGRRQLPEINDPDAYTIVVQGDAYLPVLRNGARVVAAPHASIGPGDRVVVRLSSAELVFAELVRESEAALEVKPLGPSGAPWTIGKGTVATVHRIVWAEQ